MLKAAISMKNEPTPRLTGPQQRMVAICESLWAHKPEYVISREYMFDLAQDPAEVRRRAGETALGRVLLPEGASLAAEGASEYYGDTVTMRVGATALDKASLVVRKTELPAYEKRGDDYIKNGSYTDYRLQLRFFYTEDQQLAVESAGIGISTSADDTPYVIRDVWAEAYIEQGYDGHDEKWVRASKAKSLGVLALFEQIATEEGLIVSGNEG